MPYGTYVVHNMAKQAGNHFVAGSGDFASAASAGGKSEALDDILQHFFQARGFPYNGSTIMETDIKKAIAYVRDKKHTKAVRKGVIGTAKFGLQMAATVGGATVGSVIPGAGTALGGAGGAVAGMSLGIFVTAADRLKRVVKGCYKAAKGTRGEHREQAAAALLYNANPQYAKGKRYAAAHAALEVILQEEYETVVAARDEARLAARLKSN